ncbi:MAG: cardiolipin synthase [Verrucomicrobiota bacterium]
MKWLKSLVLLGALVFVPGCASLFQKRVNYEIEPLYSVRDPQFLRSMGQLLGPQILPGNRTTGLINGDEIFPAMLEAIRGAQKTINFETYIYWSGEIGDEFAKALAERARAGVKVHLLLDWLGAGRIASGSVQEMEEAGVEIQRYHPLHWFNLSRINHRTHRKLLIVDGQIGFTGGVGIADLWMGNAQDTDHWRDSHFRLEGPAVAQMQAAFIDNWLKTQPEVLHSEEYFPFLKTVGQDYAQVFMSSPREGSESIRLMYLLSIAAARKNIRLSAAYFIPDQLARKQLVAARERGVEVEIILPGSNTDSKLVRYASRGDWGDLLKAGVKIYEYNPTMYHCKVMIVDDVWVSVGSANFDTRSFRLNDEANLNVFSTAFAAKQIAVFEEDKSKSHQISFARWKKRSVWKQVKESFCNLFRSQL